MKLLSGQWIYTVTSRLWNILQEKNSNFSLYRLPHAIQSQGLQGN